MLACGLPTLNKKYIYIFSFGNQKFDIITDTVNLACKIHSL